MQTEIDRSKMDINRSRIIVAVEKCQLCCYTRSPMTCFKCIQSGNFSHSADEFIAENNYVNKKKLWIQKKKETKEVKDELNECIKKNRIKREKLLRIQKAKINIMVMKEAHTRLHEELKQDFETYEESRVKNNVTSREIVTIKTKIKNILEHLKKQPEKQESLSTKLHSSRKELGDLRRKLSTEMIDNIFPISHSNEYSPVSAQKELTQERLKQLSNYLSKNNFQTNNLQPSQMTSISEVSLNTSNVTLTESQLSQLQLSQLQASHHLKHHLHLPHHHLKTPSLTTSSSDPSILPSSSQEPELSFYYYKSKPLNRSKLSQPPPNSPTTPINSPTTSVSTITPTNTHTNQSTNQTTNPPATNSITNTTTNTPTSPPTNTTTNTLTNPPTNPPTNTPTNPPTNTPTNTPTNPLIKSHIHSKSSAFSYQLLNTSAIKLLKEARMTAFIDGKWVYSTDHEDATLKIIHACLPANVTILLRDKKQQSSSDIIAALSLSTQLTTLLAHILDFSLPRSLHFKEFSGELAVKQLRKCLARLDVNIQALCHYENIPHSHHPSHPLRNILCLVENPLLGCDEATTSCYNEEDPEECVWIFQDSDDRRKNYKGDDEEEEEDDDEDDENEDDTIWKERLSRFPHRFRKYSCPPNMGSVGDGTWEYISPHVELIPEDSQQLQQLSTTSSMGSSESIGASVGAYVSSLIQAWRG